jgi:hypothetical protein
MTMSTTFRATATGTLLIGSLVLFAPVIQPAAAAPTSQAAPDFSNPRATFETFLKALKADDLEAAKNCWFISDDNRSGVLDSLVGEWIESRRFNQAVQSKLPAAEREALKEKRRTWINCTDEAIQRSLDRLKGAVPRVCGDRATLRIPWHYKDGTEEQPAFRLSGIRPRESLRRVKGAWKLDAHWLTGFYRPTDYFEPAGWSYSWQPLAAVLRQVTGDILAGKLSTAETIDHTLDERWQEVRRRIDKRTLSPIDQRFFAAHNICIRYRLEFYVGRGSLWGIYNWSRRLMEAEIARSALAAEKQAAADAHRDRMGDMHSETQWRAAQGRIGEEFSFLADYYAADAGASAAHVHASLGMDADPQEPETARLAAARLAYDVEWRKIEEGERALPQAKASQSLRNRAPISNASFWSERWFEAAMALATSQDDRATAAKEYLERELALEKIVKKERAADQVLETDLLVTVYRRKKAETLLAELAQDGDKGTLRDARKALLDAVQPAYQAQWSHVLERHEPVETAYDWSARWRDAALALASSKPERIGAVEAHLTRMRVLQQHAKEWWDAESFAVWATQFHIAESEIQLAEMKGK